MVFVPTLSQDQLAETSREMIENGLILNTGLPANLLADQLIGEADKT